MSIAALPPASDRPATRTACVVAGEAPARVVALGDSDGIAVEANALGTLVTGRLGDRVVDYAVAFDGPIYDVMWNPVTGWFAVTVYRGDSRPVRWDNRPDRDAGYPRVGDVLGATSPAAILAALDVPPDALGYPAA